MWRNLVARQLWELKVAGSNPAIPTFALVTKLANVLVLETRFCGFDSHQGYCMGR